MEEENKNDQIEKPKQVGFSKQLWFTNGLLIAIIVILGIMLLRSMNGVL